VLALDNHEIAEFRLVVVVGLGNPARRLICQAGMS
jgi:hypothetical protein